MPSGLDRVWMSGCAADILFEDKEIQASCHGYSTSDICPDDQTSRPLNPTGQETDGWDLEPLFEHPLGGDSRLATGCLLIDQGVLIPEFNDHFIRSGPDPGAFESGEMAQQTVTWISLARDGSDLVLEWSPVPEATYNIYTGAEAYAVPDIMLEQGWPTTTYRLFGEAALEGAAYYDVRAFQSGQESEPSPNRVGRFSVSLD